MSKLSKQKLFFAIILSSFLMSSGSQAQELASYDLDDIVVTAQKYEKKDVEIPASTIVLTKEDLLKTGTTNLQQALGTVEGLTYQAKGPGGSSMGSMTAKISMRGVESGTLVLVNGTPINLRGLYNLEDIPVDSIERLEIVKGGGSVLYGSEATGGVINIITKKRSDSYLKVGLGNYGQQNHTLNAQMGKLNVKYGYDKWKSLGKISSTLDKKKMYNEFDGSEKSNLYLTYEFNEKLNLLYSYDRNHTYFTYKFGQGYPKNVKDQPRWDRDYGTEKHFAQLNYKNAGFSGNIYVNSQDRTGQGWDYRDKDGKKFVKPKLKDEFERNRTYGTDLQNVWNLTKGKLLFGGSYNKEEYKDDNSRYSRNILSVYGQWEHSFDNKNTTIISARETWTTNANDNKNFNNFSAQGQFIHKLDTEQSLYLNVGQSFKMPTFRQMYGIGRVVGNKNLKPQEGMNYEIGWKKNHNNHKWRVAIFKIDLKDNISFSKGKKEDDNYYAKNEDFKNIGIEAGLEINAKNGWSHVYGISYNDPKSKMTTTPGANISVKDYWDRQFGRWQLTAGLRYKKEKFNASLNVNYLADRVLSPSSEHSLPEKPYLLTNFMANYEFDRQSSVTLTLDNLLDRHDNINHSSSAYYAAPFNFMVSYKYKF